ncbi:MAG: CAP domain-containing protein [Clostridia bacterium]|nr:CAP domain-containing protein [Clostridia bacterium]
MKAKLIAAALLIASASLLTACSDKKEEVPTTTAADVQAVATVSQTQTETVTETTAAPTTMLTTLLTTQREEQATTEKATKPVTTKKPEVGSTVSGRKYKDTVIEKQKLKYGVIVHKYKTIYYQMVDGEKVIYDSEYTESRYIRRDYSASYKELLPAARENRETYRSYINQILKIINGYRAEKGVAPLKLHEGLTVMSCARSEEIAWSGVREHTRPDGRKCFTIFKEAGFETGTAGENLGYGFDYPEDVCQAWKESRTHYNNIMNKKFTKVGIGVAADPDKNGKLIFSLHFLSES